MVAYGADFRSLLADYDVAAVSALPDAVTVFREYFFLLYVAEKLAVTLFVSLLDGCYHAELGCDFLEAFFVGFLSHAVVHVGPLEVLACCGCLKIACCVLDVATLKIFEPQFCVLFLVACSLLEDVCYLLVALFPCFRSKVGVLVACL